MNILVAGGYDTQNLGDYASFLGLQKVLRARFGECHFTVLSRHPNDEFAQQFDAKVIQNLDHETKEKSQGRVFFGFNEGDDCSHLQTVFESLQNADCLVLGNGRLFVDISLGFMKGPLSYYALLVSWAKLLNKPVLLSSVTLVHPTTDLGKQHLKFILENANSILVREPYSVEVARSYCRNSDKITLLPDIAFAIDPTDVESITLPFSVAENTVAVNFRGVDFTSKVGQSKLEKMVDIVSTFIENNRNPITFVPQCTYDIDNASTDDRAINRRVFEQLSASHQQHCTLIEQKLTLKETLKFYQSVDHLFTSRRHGFIMALTQHANSSLICNEENTAIVKESIDIPELYIKSDDPFKFPVYQSNKIPKILSGLKNKCTLYADRYEECFSNAC